MGWKFAFALSALPAMAAPLLLAGSTSCTSDPCTRANDLISDCASPDESVPELSQASMSLACTGTLECQALCITSASCLEIDSLQCFNAVSCAPLTGQSVASPLAACIAACSGDSTGSTDAGTD